MNILIIGGTRFMGRHLVKELLIEGHTVTIANRGVTLDDFGDSVNRIIIDRTSEDSIKANLSHLDFDVVYDCIAYCSDDIKILFDNIRCKRYIVISTMSVYDEHIDTREEDFDPLSEPVVWCKREDFDYSEIKRQMEKALAWEYKDVCYTAVRFPFVIGEDDYTKRLCFYVEHILNEKPIKTQTFENKMAFVRSDEAGKLLAFLCDKDYYGAINGASSGTISIKEVAEYVFSKTGKQIILCDDGEAAPYNGANEYSLNNDKAKELGFAFTPLHDWIYDLLDSYIKTVEQDR